MFLILKETRFQDQVLKSSSMSKKTSWKCKFIKARQLAQELICRGFWISKFWSDFLGIRDHVFGLSFLLTLNIYKDCFKGLQSVHKWHKHWANSVQANCDQRRIFCPSSSLSLEEVVVYLHRRVLWPNIFLIFIVWITEELCNQQPS